MLLELRGSDWAWGVTGNKYTREGAKEGPGGLENWEWGSPLAPTPFLRYFIF